MAVPGAPVLPPIVSSLPTAFWHPDALREEATPPAPFPAVVPLLLGLKLLVPGVLGPLELGVVVFTPLGVPVPFVPLLVALIPLLPDPVPDVAPAPLETPPEPVLAAPTPAPAAPPAPAEAPPAAPPPPAAQLIVASPDVKARVSAITAGRFMTMPSCRKHALSVRYENEANGTLVPAAHREL